MAKVVAVDGPQGGVLDLNDEERYVECVISYMQSDTLLKLEDEGMGHLLALYDLIRKMIHAGVPSNTFVAASIGNNIPDKNHYSSCTVPYIEPQPYSPFVDTHTITTLSKYTFSYDRAFSRRVEVIMGGAE